MMNRKRSLDSELVDARWKIIEESIQSLFKRQRSRHSFQSVHHAVFQLCQAHCGSRVLSNLEELFGQKSKDILSKLLKCSTTTIIDAFSSQWGEYNDVLRRVNDVLLYFNKHYIGACYRQTVQELGERIFCSTIFSDEALTSNLITAITFAIEQDNKWESINDLSKDLLYIDKGLLYERFIEAPYVRILTRKYKVEGPKRQASMLVPEYICWFEGVIQMERGRSHRLLSQTAVPKVESSLYDVLIRKCRSFILGSESGCVALVRKFDYEAIHHIASVFLLINEINAVVDIISTELTAMAEAAVSKCALSPTDAVNRMIQLVNQSHKLVASFANLIGSGAGFSRLSRAIDYPINGNHQFIEAVSFYFDTNIRQAKGKEDLRQLCEDVIALLRRIEDKDFFELSFRHYLAARLIHAKPEAIDAEYVFIEELKRQSGATAVSRLERMIEDIRNASNEETDLIHDVGMTNRQHKLDFQVTILTGAFWPQFPVVRMTFPQPMEHYMNAFRELYTSRHNGRKLVFQANLGTVTFHLSLRGHQYQISAPTSFVNTIKALNSNDAISVSQVCEVSSLSKAEVDAQVALLQRKALVSRSANSFSFNHDFFSHQRSIGIASDMISLPKASRERKAEHRQIESSRSSSIDAIIVKILKKEKSIQHDSLCEAIIKTLSPVFVPKIADIKARIEVLIGKGYVARGNLAGYYVYCE